MNDLSLVKELEKIIGSEIYQNSFESSRYRIGKTSYQLDSQANVSSLELIGHDINEYNISSVIDVILQFNNLKKLRLSHTKIHTIAYLAPLNNLISLNLTRNGLTSIDDIKYLTSLKSLTLSNNLIENIESISYLKELEYLSCIENKITNISPLEDLPYLGYVNLSNNIIPDISSLNYMSRIKEAWFNSNNVLTVDYLRPIKTLKKLGLGKNNLNNIDFITNLENLEELQLSENNISSLESLKYVPNLRNLVLNRNLIFDISPLSDLTNLTKLSISSNVIADISPLENLKNLRLVNLSYNNIRNIDILTQLKNLTFLNLSNNFIRELPREITKLNMTINYKPTGLTEKGILIHNNPIINIPNEIIIKGNNAIERYFLKIENEGKDYIYEAKLIFVGEGSAGKTSLQKRLINKNASLPKKDKRTRGIEINDWIIKKSGTQKHIAHIWDFGGQDVYYPVHRFFITENSVFVLLASTRQTHHNFDYWIPTIYQFGGKSPIIIGQTCYDGNRVPWNDLGVYLSNDNFNIIKTQDLPYYEIDLPQKNSGLDVIKETIKGQIVSLPHYGRSVPKSWVLVRNYLIDEAKKHPCIFFDAFESLCKSIDYDAFADSTDVSDCCQFLHDIGVVLWYKNNSELKYWVILQPEWAMNAVYKIIDDSEIQTRRGHIMRDDFARLWADKSYSNKHEILKTMLEIFKISFPKKHKYGEYIIPARLLSMPNYLKWSSEKAYLRLEYNYDFMPRGLVNQLSAELSRYISDEANVWNNAVYFEFENKQAICQVIEDFYNRNISIRATGKDARALIMLIMNSLNNIIDGYKGVRAKISVPCICSECLINEKPTVFTYEKLLEWYTKKSFVVCNESGDSISIEELLFNVGLSSPQITNSSAMSKTITIFLASSAELINDREQFEIFINRENKRLNNQGIFLNLELWEDFLDAMSKTRLQDMYNKAIKECDIFVSLFFTKVGKFTEEEFEVAYNQFKTSNKPYVYTYFKDAPINTSKINQQDINSKFAFQSKLSSLEHFPTLYSNIDDLKYKFKAQLDKLLPIL